MESTILPVVLALTAAFFFATSSSLVRAGIRDASVFVALFLSLTVNMLFLWTVVFVLLDVTINLWEWRYFIIAGTLAPVMGRFFNYSGIDKLGINISAPITYANPLVSVALALAFLGERLTFLGFVGALLVIVGGSVLGSSKGSGTISFEKKYLVLPVLAALFYGSSHIFRKVGIDLVPSPLLASAVTITTSWAILVLYLGVTYDQHDFAVRRREFAYFSLAGVATSVAIPTLYLALQTGTVVVVTPLMNTSPLFVLLFSFVFFRHAELFTIRVLSGTAFIVAGVILLSTFGTIP